MPHLWLTYHEEESGGEVCEGDEDDAYPSHEDTIITWHLEQCHVEPVKHCYNMKKLEVDFEPIVGSYVCVVYVRYGTGDTFGHTDGAWEIVGAYQNQDEAVSIKKSICDNPDAKHCAWTGYFESFESCGIELMEVLAGA